MEEYKIYRVGNYFRIENVHTKEIFNGASKEVFVDASNTGKSEYRFFNVKNWKEIKSLKLNQIKKQDGTTYTLGEWESFYTDNTVTFGGTIGGTSILHITSNVTLQTPTGELVFMQTLSDGTIEYNNPDGTPYVGNTAMLLPYNWNPSPIVTTLAINDTVDSGSSIPYLEIPFTGIVLGEPYTITVVGLPTEIIQSTSITENDKVNLSIENQTPNPIIINTTITIIAVKQ